VLNSEISEDQTQVEQDNFTENMSTASRDEGSVNGDYIDLNLIVKHSQSQEELLHSIADQKSSPKGMFVSSTGF
jgi:hypothetical protein